MYRKIYSHKDIYIKAHNGRKHETEYHGFCVSSAKIDNVEFNNLLTDRIFMKKEF